MPLKPSPTATRSATRIDCFECEIYDSRGALAAMTFGQTPEEAQLLAFTLTWFFNQAEGDTLRDRLSTGESPSGYLSRLAAETGHTPKDKREMFERSKGDACQ